MTDSEWWRMAVFWQDLVQLALATVLAPLLGIFPGFAVLWLGERLGWLRLANGWTAASGAALIGLAIFPAVDALAIRWIGLGFVTLLHCVAGVAGLFRASRLRWAVEPICLAVAGIWWTLVAISMVDIGTSRGLFQSLIVMDLVKHAAVVEAIVRDGLPLVDPFFLRPVQAGYYYYYYLWGAETQWLSFNLLSGRIAYTGTLIWCGPAFVALLWQLVHLGGFVRPGRSRRMLHICLFLCFVGGADIPAMLLRWWAVGVLEQQSDCWTEEMRFALTSMMWTPHHLAALISIWVAVLALLRSRLRVGTERVVLVIGAGLAFATAFGMSVWIAFTAGLFLLSWCLMRFRQERVLVLCIFCAAGVAAIFAVPQFFDLLTGRKADSFPIAPTVRMFLWLRADYEPMLAPILLLLLPTAYAIEFGAFAFGASLYRRLRPPVPDHTAALVRSLLLTSAIAGLLVASFLRATILNNDLGWRAPWFAQLAAMVWTACVLQNMPRLLKPPRAFVALLLLGLLPNIYDMFGLRVIRESFVTVSNPEINMYPEIDASLRSAYSWANNHLPTHAVLQHNPRAARRAIDFGLYGHFRTGVADAEAMLFGASREEVNNRIARLMPIFSQTSLRKAQIINIARAQGVDALIFTRMDEAWRKGQAAPADLRCAWHDINVCIVWLGEELR